MADTEGPDASGPVLETAPGPEHPPPATHVPDLAPDPESEPGSRPWPLTPSRSCSISPWPAPPATSRPSCAPPVAHRPTPTGPAPQIAALTVRDGPGCRFPGCSHTRHPRAHHVQHWLHRGPTDLDNLVLVCGFHHRLIHDTGYTIRWEDGKWLFSRPDGTPVPEAGAPLDGNTESLIELNTRARLRITRDSLTPYWTGERLDPDPILQHLLPRQRNAAA